MTAIIMDKRGEAAWRSATFDFTSFEDTLFDEWALRFRTRQGPGQFSLLPVADAAHNQTSLYGSTDMVYAHHAMGRLTDFSRAERAEWAEAIHSFQEQNGSGWFVLQPWEKLHVANPPHAKYAWHAAGAAVDALALLSSPEPQLAPFAPRRAFSDVQQLMAAGPTAWRAFMRKWLTGTANPWLGSQAVQSLAAVVKLTPGQPSRDVFARWLLTEFNRTASAATGMWHGTPAQGAEQQIGAAFHLYHVYQCYARGWGYAEASVDTVLAAQDRGIPHGSGTGTWGTRGQWSERDQWSTVTSCIDVRVLPQRPGPDLMPARELPDRPSPPLLCRPRAVCMPRFAARRSLHGGTRCHHCEWSCSAVLPLGRGEQRM
jgi:hypothetical protein